MVGEHAPYKLGGEVTVATSEPTPPPLKQPHQSTVTLKDQWKNISPPTYLNPAAGFAQAIQVIRKDQFE